MICVVLYCQLDYLDGSVLLSQHKFVALHYIKAILGKV